MVADSVKQITVKQLKFNVQRKRGHHFENRFLSAFSPEDLASLGFA